MNIFVFKSRRTKSMKHNKTNMHYKDSGIALVLFHQIKVFFWILFQRVFFLLLTWNGPTLKFQIKNWFYYWQLIYADISLWKQTNQTVLIMQRCVSSIIGPSGTFFTVSCNIKTHFFNLTVLIKRMLYV